MRETRKERSDGDFTIARQVARSSGTEDVRPRHIRLMGVASILGALMCFGFSYDHINFQRSFFPKLVALIPVLGTTGIWYLLDASALASGRRRHQKLILGACIGLSLVVGLIVITRLGRGS